MAASFRTKSHLTEAAGKFQYETTYFESKQTMQTPNYELREKRESITKVFGDPVTNASVNVTTNSDRFGKTRVDPPKHLPSSKLSSSKEWIGTAKRRNLGDKSNITLSLSAEAHSTAKYPLSVPLKKRGKKKEERSRSKYAT